MHNATDGEAIADVVAKYEHGLRLIATAHYQTFRNQGGFGPRVAATLAATAVLTKEAETIADHPEYVAAYVVHHKKVADFLVSDIESVYQKAVAATTAEKHGV